MPSPADSGLRTRPPVRAAVFGSLREGWRRTLRAPGVIVSVWIAMAVITLPVATTLHDAVGVSADSAMTTGHWSTALELRWTGEFALENEGLTATLAREIFGATTAIVTLGLLGSEVPTPAVAAAIATYIGMWAFLSGGTIDRLARARPFGATTFIALSGRYFFRMLRLTAIAALVYGLLLGILYPWLSGTAFDWWMFGGNGEPQAVAVADGLHVVVILLMGVVAVVVDFARIRLVVEDRRSALSALGSGLRFVRRRFLRVAGVYGLNVVALTGLAQLWIQTGSGDVETGWYALLLTQLYVVVRVCGRMAFFASEAVFFQSELAHAEYTAAPLPTWPDSVSVEAIRNLKRDG